MKRRKALSNECIDTMVQEMIAEVLLPPDSKVIKAENVVDSHLGPNEDLPEPSAEPFQFEEMANFDARKGYRSCASPGVTSHLSDGQHADASLWRDSKGNVVARFSSRGYRFSFMVHRHGKPIQDYELIDLVAYLSDLLVWWMIEGIDDQPTTDLTTLNRR